MCDNTTAVASSVDVAMEWIGAAGGFVLGVCLLPQLIHSFRMKSTQDLSYSWQITYLLGLGCITLYAGWAGLWPIYAPATVELASIVLLLALKIHYDGCTKEAWTAFSCEKKDEQGDGAAKDVDESHVELEVKGETKHSAGESATKNDVEDSSPQKESETLPMEVTSDAV